MAVLPLVASHVAILAVYDLARSPVLTFPALAFAFASWLWAARRLEHRASAGAVLLVAAGLRLLLVPLPPTLSDDTLRYAWDGKVVLAGWNPYLLAPDSEELAPLRDELWERMPHRQVATVYPPLALAFFSLGRTLPEPLRGDGPLGIKILLAVAELAGCLFLVRLAERLKLPPGRAVWYCWNPLVTLEVAGMGHVDGLLAAAMIAAVLLLVAAPRRPFAAAAAAAAGVLSKLVPLVALPLWARHSGRPFRFLAVALALAGAALVPVAASTGGVPPGLRTYGVSWQWNGPLFEPLSSLLAELPAVETVKGGLDGLKDRTGRHDFWNRFYPYVYPELLAKMLLAGVFAVFFLLSLRDRHPVSGSGRLFGGLLLCSATVYPWYLLWVLPWAALGRHRAWLALSASIQLSYLPQITDLPHLPWVFLAVWVPFFVLWPSSRWSLRPPWIPSRPRRERR